MDGGRVRQPERVYFLLQAVDDGGVLPHRLVEQDRQWVLLPYVFLHLGQQVPTDVESAPRDYLNPHLLYRIAVGRVPHLHAGLDFLLVLVPPVLHQYLVLVLESLDVLTDPEAYFEAQLSLVGPETGHDLVEVVLGTPLDVAVGQHLQEEAHLHVVDSGGNEELQEKREQVAEVAGDIDTAQFPDVFVALGKQPRHFLEVLQLEPSQHGLGLVHDDVELLVLLPLLFLPDRDYLRLALQEGILICAGNSAIDVNPPPSQFGQRERVQGQHLELLFDEGAGGLVHWVSAHIEGTISDIAFLLLYQDEV